MRRRYHSRDTHEGSFNLADLGGNYSFQEGTRWPCYVDGYAVEWLSYVEAIRLSIIEHNGWAGGD